MERRRWSGVDGAASMERRRGLCEATTIRRSSLQTGVARDISKYLHAATPPPPPPPPPLHPHYLTSK
jgi:hypothetical protein